jgi:hypothetical protein
MRPLEEIIESDEDAGRAFWDDCTAVFSGGAGARVLKRLCELAHPLNHAPVGDPVLCAHLRGRSEIVAALWRRSQSTIEPRDIPKT